MNDQELISPAEQRLRDLVVKMRQGPSGERQAALGDFYDAVRRQLIQSRWARQLDGGQFDDVFHEAMLGIWDGLRHFRHEARLTTWIHRIFRNKAVDAARRSGRKLEVPLDPEDHLALPSDEPELAILLSRQQVEKFLRTCMTRARKAYPVRVQALDYAQDGFSMQEIAELVEAPIGTVKRWLSEVRSLLQACLVRHGVTTVDG